MKLFSILEYETNRGEEITFERKEHFKLRETGNSLWAVHRLIAYLDGEEAGYLDISYIPQERMKGTSLLNYMDQKGWPLNLNGNDWRTLDVEGKREALETIIKYMVGHSQWEPQFDKAASASEEQLDQMIGAYEHRLRKTRHGRAAKEFYAFHVDKPLVDMIKVHRVYRRQGVGSALYQEGTKWMKEKGMTLHASGIQSDQAKATWDSLSSRFDVQTTKHGRKFLNV